MPIDGINPYSRTADTAKTETQTPTPQPDNSNLTTTDFLKLFAAQLRYQDMSNPMSNSEMMNQLTQMTTMQSMTSMVTAMNYTSSTIETLLMSSAQSYATSMIGQEVTVAVVDKEGAITEKITGKVTGVNLYTAVPTICINGKNYPFNQVMSVGVVPPPMEDVKPQPDPDPDDSGE